jgi:hypothetical protein
MRICGGGETRSPLLWGGDYTQRNCSDSMSGTTDKSPIDPTIGAQGEVPLACDNLWWSRRCSTRPELSKLQISRSDRPWRSTCRGARGQGGNSSPTPSNSKPGRFWYMYAVYFADKTVPNSPTAMSNRYRHKLGAHCAIVRARLRRVRTPAIRSPQSARAETRSGWKRHRERDIRLNYAITIGLRGRPFVCCTVVEHDQGFGSFKMDALSPSCTISTIMGAYC